MKSERFLEALNYIDSKYIEEARCKTMKKRFNFKPIITVAACAAFALAAVPLAKHFAGGFINNTEGTQTSTTAKPEAPIGASGKFTVLYAGSADSYSGIALEKETDFDGIGTKFTDKTKKGTNYTVTISGITYTGTYVDSTKSDYYRDDTDNYYASVDGKKITFSINRETGVCTMFYVSGKSTGKELTHDECYEKAFEHARSFVADIENYKLIRDEKRAEGYGYIFVWQRYIAGIKASDLIAVAIRENGEIYDYSLDSINSFKDADVSRINMSKIETAIADKIKSSYAEYSDIYPEIKNATLTRTAEDKYIIVYDVKVTLTKQGSDVPSNYLQKIVVEID